MRYWTKKTIVSNGDQLDHILILFWYQEITFSFHPHPCHSEKPTAKFRVIFQCAFLIKVSSNLVNEFNLFQYNHLCFIYFLHLIQLPIDWMRLAKLFLQGYWKKVCQNEADFYISWEVWQKITLRVIDTDASTFDQISGNFPSFYPILLSCIVQYTFQPTVVNFTANYCTTLSIKFSWRVAKQ